MNRNGKFQLVVSLLQVHYTIVSFYRVNSIAILFIIVHKYSYKENFESVNMDLTHS